MTLHERLTRFADSFAVGGAPVYHYWRPQLKAPFIVWAEDAAPTMGSDNAAAEQAITGTVDLYTQTEFDPLMDAVQAALTGTGASWELNSVQYEEETGLIHYEWAWAVM